MAYDRAVFYGLQILGQNDPGFNQAKGNQQTLEDWLKKNFTRKEDAPYLLWTGVPWMARAGLMAGDDEEGPGVHRRALRGRRHPRARRRRSTRRSITTPGSWSWPSYHARSNMAELDEAKKLLDTAMEKTQGRRAPHSLHLRDRVMRARRAMRRSTRACSTRSCRPQDPDPDERMPNAVAKRAAKRWLGKHRAKDQCGIDLGGSASSQRIAAAAPAGGRARPAPAPAPAPAPPTETKPAKPAKPEHPHKPTAMAKPASSSAR